MLLLGLDGSCTDLDVSGYDQHHADAKEPGQCDNDSHRDSRRGSRVQLDTLVTKAKVEVDEGMTPERTVAVCGVSLRALCARKRADTLAGRDPEGLGERGRAASCP